MAAFIKFLASRPRYLERFHAWRGTFAVLNEHGYFRSDVRHYCRLCQALNYDRVDDTSGPGTYYRNLGSFWNYRKDCRLIKYGERAGEAAGWIK